MDDKDIAQATLTGGSPAPGEIYRHYMGGLYVVMARAIDEASLEPLVIYRSNEKGYVWARPLSEWRERFQHDFKVVTRFTRVEE